MMMRLDELKDQLRQLNEMIRVGELQGDAARKARDTLEAEVLDAVLKRDAVPISDPLAATARPSRRLLVGLVAFVLVFGGVGYAWLGNREGLFVSPGVAALADPGGASYELGAAQIELMAERLAGRLKEQPDDAQGWSMLGRSYGVLGRFPQARQAYQRVISLRPQDAQAYADYADVSAMANGGKLDGEPEKMIERALQLDPDNAKALSLAGTLALKRGDAALAASHLERALRGVDPASDMANQIQSALDEARQRSGPLSLAASSARSQAGTADTKTLTGGSATAVAEDIVRTPSVKVHVTLSTALRARAAPDDTVFVFARAVQGPKAPLAIQRLRVRDLPLIVTLDDTTSMSPALRLSTVAEVVIGARISKTGNALAQPGDLQGLSPAVAVGAHDARVEISEVVN